MPHTPTDSEAIIGLLRAGHRLISIVTTEEHEALDAVRSATDSLGLHRFRWAVLDGVADDIFTDTTPQPDTTDPAAALYWMSTLDRPTVFVALDLVPHLNDPRTLRALRRLLGTLDSTGGQLVMVDHSGDLPDVVRAYATPFELSLPDEASLEALVRATLRQLHRERPIEIRLSQSDYRMVIKNLLGLTRRQARQVIRDAVRDDDSLRPEDLNAVLASKRRMVSSSGLLEYVESPATLEDVGGMGRLKHWLKLRARAFDPELESLGVTPPRGVLLLGVQGAGKSLCAKAIATAWQRPLLRMDPGVLYNRFVGETERRLRDALVQAETMAPVVLWVDEIEKAFASAATHSTDGGLSQRMFGTLLTWMQDHRSPVFLVATANNIEALPPELLRKGRFDEIFFVDLPGPEARRAILHIHLRRRGRLSSPVGSQPAGIAGPPPETIEPGFDMDRLVAASEGYSGAEIEQAIISAIYATLDSGGPPQSLCTDGLVAALEGSPPLSVIMRERIERLRDWAKDRCVLAE